jgi:hypothetical protein
MIKIEVAAWVIPTADCGGETGIKIIFSEEEIYGRQKS